MRLLNLLLALSPLARVSSTIPQEWGNSSGPLGGKLINDPARLPELHAMHDEVIRMLNTGEAIPVERSTNLTGHGQHDKRVYQAFGLLGDFVACMFGLKTIEKITDKLPDLFTGGDIVWTSKDNCRAYFSTQGGGNEVFRTYGKDHGNPTSEVYKKDNTARKLDGTTTETSYEVGFLFPGSWNFEFCVSAFNGNLETAPVSCITPPVCCGYRKRDLVPGNYTVAEDVAEDKGLADLFAAYQQTAEFAPLVEAGYGREDMELPSIL
ncbi:hypothetical protein IFM60648_06888 [Aspergillus lentulus]|uniref:Uncharacterized protein n=1 Tax=Aspergillus lentulus TaxID=293939 RepID=A0ABQ1ALC7_ASPLE|nr:hypothetical protein IFM60648_06888 [Aspergillus lentulus]